MIVFCTHRELFKLRPGWRDDEDCRGRMIVDSDSEQDEIWVALCDECGLEIGIPPRQRESWFQDVRS